jgi:hypothetical protein
MPKFYGTQRGSGNVLGLDKSLDADSIILAAEAGAATLEERAFFTTRLAQVIVDVEEYAKSVDGYVPYKYMNYADPSPLRISSALTGRTTLRFSSAWPGSTIRPGSSRQGSQADSSCPMFSRWGRIHGTRMHNESRKSGNRVMIET